MHSTNIMKKMRIILTLFFAVVLSSAAENAALQEGSTRWTGFRGNHGNGHTAAINLPLTWSDTENIKWTIDLKELICVEER